MAKILFKCFLGILLSFVINLLIVRLGGYPFGHNIKFATNFLFGFFIVFFSHRFRYKTAYFIVMLAPALVIYFLIFDSTNWEFYTLHTPSSLAFFFGLFTGIIFSFLKNRVSYYSLVAVSLILNLYVLFVGYDTWIHKINYGTFTGTQDFPVDNLVFKESLDSSKVLLNDKETLYLLDFWATNCAPCIEEFPTVQKIYYQKEYVNKKFKVFLINVPYKDKEYALAREILKTKQISIPLMYFDKGFDTLKMKFHVNAFPTVLLIRNNRILHIGDIYTTKKRLQELL